MDLYRIKSICNGYLNETKGYTAEIDNYNEGTERIVFDVRILKHGAFIASQSIRITKASGLTAESQLSSQIERFSAFVENNPNPPRL